MDHLADKPEVVRNNGVLSRGTVTCKSAIGYVKSPKRRHVSFDDETMTELENRGCSTARLLMSHVKPVSQNDPGSASSILNVEILEKEARVELFDEKLCSKALKDDQA